MIPVDENLVLPKDWLLAQLDSMVDTKRVLLGMDCKEKNMIGFSYDTGYISALLELKKLILNPPKSAKKDEDDIEDDA